MWINGYKGVLYRTDTMPRELINLLYLHRCSWNDAVKELRNGCISEKDFKHFEMFWEWCCPRFSSNRQEAVYQKFGKEFLHRRFERMNRIRDAYIRGLIQPYVIMG